MRTGTPGQALRRLREGRPNRPSRQTVGVAIGVSQSAIAQWETDVHPPRKDHAEALDTYLEAHGEVLTLFGYAATQPAGELAQLQARVAELEAQVGLLLEVSNARGEGDPDWPRRSIEGEP